MHSCWQVWMIRARGVAPEVPFGDLWGRSGVVSPSIGGHLQKLCLKLLMTV